MIGELTLKTSPDPINTCRWLNSPTNMQFSERRHYKHTPESVTDYWRKHYSDPSYIWSINVDNLHVGNITAEVDPHNGVATLGILIGHEYWGKGYGLRAWSGAMKVLAKEGLRKVEAGCMAINAGMVRIFLSSGMALEGNRRNHFLVHGEAVDMILVGKFLQ